LYLLYLIGSVRLTEYYCYSQQTNGLLIPRLGGGRGL